MEIQTGEIYGNDSFSMTILAIFLSEYIESLKENNAIHLLSLDVND